MAPPLTFWVPLSCGFRTPPESRRVYRNSSGLIVGECFTDPGREAAPLEIL